MIGALALGATLLLAQAASASAPNPCAAVAASEVGAIVGLEVEPPDPVSASAGTCFFASRDAAEDGSATYTVLSSADLPKRRRYYAVLALRCGGIAPGAPNALICGAYRKLAAAQTIEAYFAVRSASPDALPVGGLGDVAVATPAALFVRRGEQVFEFVVEVAGMDDPVREQRLARLVLSRIAQFPAPGTPSPKPHPRRSAQPQG